MRSAWITANLFHVLDPLPPTKPRNDHDHKNLTYFVRPTSTRFLGLGVEAGVVIFSTRLVIILGSSATLFFGLSLSLSRSLRQSWFGLLTSGPGSLPLQSYRISTSYVRPAELLDLRNFPLCICCALKLKHRGIGPRSTLKPLRNLYFSAPFFSPRRLAGLAIPD